MIKIGNYTSAAEVCISSDNNSFNFEAPYADAPAIKDAFDAANVVEFELVGNHVELYSPQLRLIQMGSGDNAIVMFTAAKLPEDKTEELAGLTEQMEDASGTTEAIAEGLEELAVMIAELEERVTALEGGK